MALNLGELQVLLQADTSEFRTNLDKAGSKMAAVGAQFAKLGAGMAAALGGAAIASAKMAADFEKDMANVGTLLGKDGSARVEELGSDVKRLAQETGKPLNDLAGGLYQVVSAFGDGADSAKILETAAKASAAGLATTEDAVNLLSAVTKGYGDTSAAAVAKVSDLAFQTVKLGQTTFPELAANMGKVIPLGATLGTSMESLFGAMSTLTGVTGNTAEVSTQLRATLQALINPSTEMQAAFEKVGYASGAAAIQSDGLQGVLKRLQEETGGNTSQLAKMFGSVEALNAVLALTGPQAQNFAEKTAAMTTAAGETANAFAIQQKTVSASMARISQSLSVVGVTLGEAFLPAIANAAEMVSKHLPEMQAFVENAMSKSGAAFESLRERVQPVLDTLGRIFGKFVEVGRLLWSEFGDEVTAIFKTTWGTVTDVFSAALKVIEGVLDVFAGAFTGDWSRMKEGVLAVWGGLWDGVSALVEGAWNVLKIAFGGLYDSFSGWFTNLVKDATTWGSNVMSGFWDGITGWFSSIQESLANFAKGIAEKVKGALDIRSPSGVFEGIGANIGKGLAEGIEGTQRLVEQAMAKLTPMSPSLAFSAPNLGSLSVPAAERMSSFAANLHDYTSYTGAGVPAEGRGAMAAGGSMTVHVNIGNRELYDLVIEAIHDGEQRGRIKSGTSNFARP